MEEPGRPAAPAFEDYPLTRQEYISAMVHFYRGEMYRSQVWRMRLDTTTNWAVVTTAGVISFTFGDPSHPHILLLLANLLIAIFLIHEARRYRYFSVYRARVRMLEENFFLPLLTRRLTSPMLDWGERVAVDLDQPKFKTTFFEAIGFRLSRSYLWVFLILTLAWLVKLLVHPSQAVSALQVYERMAVGPLPPYVVLLGCLAFLAVNVWAVVVSWRVGFTHDEVTGLEKDLAHWRL